ncbi:MAG: DUF2933 domain-containing protein [Chloroflexi bacterium]|nr:DUF2933 domain-containing protein [Chloroflexota bacterium]
MGRHQQSPGAGSLTNIAGVGSPESMGEENEDTKIPQAESPRVGKRRTPALDMLRMLGMCINPRVVGGLALVGLAAWLVAPQLVWGILPLLLLAMCPLSMLFMAWKMRGSDVTRTTNAQPYHTVGQQARAQPDTAALAQALEPTSDGA